MSGRGLMLFQQNTFHSQIQLCNLVIDRIEMGLDVSTVQRISEVHRMVELLMPPRLIMRQHIILFWMVWAGWLWRWGVGVFVIILEGLAEYLHILIIVTVDNVRQKPILINTIVNLIVLVVVISIVIVWKLLILLCVVCRFFFVVILRLPRCDDGRLLLVCVRNDAQYKRRWQTMNKRCKYGMKNQRKYYHIGYGWHKIYSDCAWIKKISDEKTISARSKNIIKIIESHVCLSFFFQKFIE